MKRITLAFIFVYVYMTLFFVIVIHTALTQRPHYQTTLSVNAFGERLYEVGFFIAIWLFVSYAGLMLWKRSTGNRL